MRKYLLFGRSFADEDEGTDMIFDVNKGDKDVRILG